MLLKSFSSVLFLSLFALTANAGIGLHYSGQPVQDGEDFNFAVSSTNPSSMEPSDSPSEPTSPYFSHFFHLRKYALMSRSAQTSFSGGGVGGGSGRAAGFGGGQGVGMHGKKNYGGQGVGSARREIGGGFGSGGPGGGGGGTTSNDQTVSGTDGIVCVTNTGTTDPGNTDGDNGGGDNGDGGDGQLPSPSPVPEPSSFAFWTLMTGMLIFGTRRIAS